MDSENEKEAPLLRSSAVEEGWSPRDRVDAEDGAAALQDVDFGGWHDQMLSWLCAFCMVLKGLAYPTFRVTLVAVMQKLFSAVYLESAGSISPEAQEKLQEEMESSYSAIMKVYLMIGLDFYQTIGISIGLVMVVVVFGAVDASILEKFTAKREVMRLQHLFMQKIIAETNPQEIDLHGANQLVHTHLEVVEQFASKTKYSMYNHVVRFGTTVALMTTVAWDLGVMTILIAVVCLSLGQAFYLVLSKPWADSLDEREATTKARILDLIICKDVVRTHGQELKERDSLEAMLENADAEKEMRRLVVARLVHLIIANLVLFTIPVQFFYIYSLDLSYNRMFQIFLFMLLQAEMVSTPGVDSYSLQENVFRRLHPETRNPIFQVVPILDYIGEKNIREKYSLAKREISKALQMDESDVFPHALHWPVAATGPSRKDDYVPVQTQELEPELESVLLQQQKANSVIKVANLSLGYTLPNKKTIEIIQDFNANFKLGDRYALMGETGCGKTTILKFLAGLLKPFDGDLSVDGMVLDTTSLKWRHDYIGIVAQDSILFNRTLRENLTYGVDGSVDDTAIFDALDKVNMKDFVSNKLPHGLDTVISANGREFSGGQRQRMQICRLLMRNRPFVLLDEFTSNLDRETTEDILRILEEYLGSGGQKTLVMITHDIQTLSVAKHVMNLKSGGGYDLQST